MNAIEVRDLRKLYGAKAAVDGLSFTVPQGSFFGFLGPNGAGKTTTIRMLMGLAPPTSGTIRLLDLQMPERALEIKRQIGLVPDESLLFDHLTGAEFIEFAGRIYGLERAVARERASELLDFTPQEWRLLDDGGMITFDLPPDAVGEALQIKAGRPRLSANDCFCLVTTLRHEEAVLLTRIAGDMGAEVHGVLWLHDRLHEAGNSPLDLLVNALEIWRGDPAVFLPNDEIEARLRVLRRLT